MATAFTGCSPIPLPRRLVDYRCNQVTGRPRIRNRDMRGDLTPKPGRTANVCVGLRGTPVSNQHDGTSVTYQQFVLLKDLTSGLNDEELPILLARA